MTTDETDPRSLMYEGRRIVFTAEQRGWLLHHLGNTLVPCTAGRCTYDGAIKRLLAIVEAIRNDAKRGE
jgi:hypothetical protein